MTTGLIIIWIILFIVAWVITFFSIAESGVVDSIWALALWSFVATTFEIAFLFLAVYAFTKLIEVLP